MSEQWPAEVVHASFVARLINDQYIVNVNVGLEHDPEVRAR